MSLKNYNGTGKGNLTYNASITLELLQICPIASRQPCDLGQICVDPSKMVYLHGKNRALPGSTLRQISGGLPVLVREPVAVRN